MSMRHSDAADRNREPILTELARLLTRPGDVLEIAAGTGQHAVHFAQALPHLTWQPTDLDPDALASIAARRDAAALPNLLPPQPLDVTARPWGHAVDAILACNLIHIAPWEVSEHLFAGAAEGLRPNGLLITYGPYRFADTPLEPSNVAFNAWLEARDPRFGIRDVDALDALAARVGLRRIETIAMPANNHLLVWARTATRGRALLEPLGKARIVEIGRGLGVSIPSSATKAEQMATLAGFFHGAVSEGLWQRWRPSGVGEDRP